MVTQVTLSAKGLALSRTNGHNDVPIILGVIQQDKSEKNTPNTSRDKSPVEEIVDAKTSNVGILSLEQRRDIAKLRLRDMEVRAQIQAHMASAGKYSKGGVNYEFEKGPDGRSYATNGEVSISIPEGKTPEENLRIAIQVERAVTSSPSITQADRAVSALARRKAALARKEILENALRRGSDEFVILGSNPAPIELKKSEAKMVELPGSIAANAYIPNSHTDSSREDDNSISV